MPDDAIPDIVGFNRPTLVGREFDLIAEALERMHLSGNGAFTKRCQSLVEASVGGRALLTHSCTGALEMAAILSGIGVGDEVIMPSFTFTSTANAFVLRGAVPVFVDVRADTLNLDETLIEAAITPATRAICVVHYAGVGCDMDAIMGIAARHGLRVIEDAAQALHATWRGTPLGAFGDFAAFSFHETKNVIAGEGGALVIRDPADLERAEIIWEKGTNRAAFQRGAIAKYEWVDLGSSFLPSEITAAFLLAQLEDGPAITARRLEAWHRYHAAFRDLEEDGRLRRPRIPQDAGHNGHIYQVIAPTPAARDRAAEALRDAGVQAVMHYVPLHSAPAGRRFGRVHGGMAVTDDLPARLLRLPMHARFDAAAQDRVIAAVRAAFS